MKVSKSNFHPSNIAKTKRSTYYLPHFQSCFSIFFREGITWFLNALFHLDSFDHQNQFRPVHSPVFHGQRRCECTFLTSFVILDKTTEIGTAWGRQRVWRR